jgi:uncharacterized repeat protein (TIGR04042 family)
MVPEMSFVVRWPDGEIERCYSPSTVVGEFFRPGHDYLLADFVDRSRRALTTASERVREKYGFGCANAAAQLADIERRAGAFGGRDVRVVVEGFEQWN